MRKGIIALIAGIALFAIGAFAASFALTSEDVSSGGDAVSACAPNAKVTWTINDNNAVVTSTTTGANFLITDATVTVPGGAAACVGAGAGNFVLAIEFNGTNETRCKGSLAAGGTGGVDAVATVSLATCSAGTSLNVSQVTGAALLIGDKTIPLSTTP
jgi:hypothetical protein